MSSRSERKRKRRRIPRRRVLTWGLGTLAGLIILVAVLFGLFRIAANMVPGYHDAIAKQVSEQVGAPVKLGHVSLTWHGWGPELQFDKPRVKNASGQMVLSAKHLRLDFTLLSLIHGKQARPYAIALVAPRVILQQMPDGSIEIPGLSLPSGAAGQLGAMLGEQLRVTNGRITLHWAGEEQETWVFAPVDLRVSAGKSHTVGLSAQLPAALGGKTLFVSGEVKTTQSDPSGWHWQLQYRLDRLALQPLMRFAPKRWVGLRGRLKVTGNAKGKGARLHTASGRLALQELNSSGDDLKQARTQYAFATGNPSRLTLSQLALSTQTQTWKPGRIQFAWHDQGRIHLDIARLDLSLLSHLGGLMPASLKDFSKRLQAMQPDGKIEGFKLAFTPGKVSSLALKASLEDIGSQPAAGVPGFSHISGKVALHHGMGLFKLDAPGLTVMMPYIFGHPVKLDRARGRIGIAFTESAIRVATPGLHLQGTAGLNGLAMAEITVPWHGPVTMRVAAEQPGAMDTVAARANYFPAAMLPKPLVKWLMNQLEGGEVGGARLRFAGEVKRFPFNHGGGHFSVNFGFHDVTLKPQKNWEPLKKLGGTVAFKNAGMRATVTHGRIVNARVVHADVSIPDLAKPLLAVQADVAGQVSDFLTFLRNSPIGSDVSFGIDQFKTRGAASAHVKLHIPVLHINQFTLTGAFSLKDVDVKYIGQPYRLQDLNGTVHFDQQGPVSSRLGGKLLATPITIELSRARGTQGKELLKIGMSGDFPVTALSKVSGQSLNRYAEGHVPLRAKVQLPLSGQGLPLDIDLHSSLKGLELKLPVPVGKSALALLPFDARVHVERKRIDVNARYANVGSLCTTIVHSGQASGARDAEVRLGPGKCKAPSVGYRIVGTWPVVHLGDWLGMISSVKGATSSGASTKPASKTGAPASTTRKKAATSSFWPEKTVRINVGFKHLEMAGESLENQAIRGKLGHDSLRLALTGPDLAGKVRVPRKPDNDNPIQVKLTRAHFKVGPGEKTTAPASTSATAPATSSPRQTVSADKTSKSNWKPRDVPPFTLQATHLILGKAAFDNVNIRARRVPHGIAIKPIKIGGGVMSLNAQFVWLESESHSQGALQLLAHIQHLGDLLQGLGVGSVATGHGNLSAALAWQKPREGGKFAEGLLGKVSMDLRDGNISKVSPGAGRLLSLLNLVNIPRYLTFDFHNLFGKGFPYSRIYGDYHIRKGIARTKAFRIDSSVADIKLSGDINLVADTMDQTAEVRPNYFGSLPVIGALVGGLGVGAAVFILAKLFGKPIGKALELTYHIHGPITNPEVVKAGEEKSPQKAPAPASR
jgi:uncharacterized protein (TIGR02099 family)